MNLSGPAERSSSVAMQPKNPFDLLSLLMDLRHAADLQNQVQAEISALFEAPNIFTIPSDPLANERYCRDLEARISKLQSHVIESIGIQESMIERSKEALKTAETLVSQSKKQQTSEDPGVERAVVEETIKNQERTVELLKESLEDQGAILSRLNTAASDLADLKNYMERIATFKAILAEGRSITAAAETPSPVPTSTSLPF
jgi:hypothetical protein